MNQSWLDDANFFTASSSCSSHPFCSHCLPQPSSKNRNICQVLAWREVSPRTKHSSKKLQRSPSKQRSHCSCLSCGATDARQAVLSWVEAESLRHLSAKYCPLFPPPRSTIAAAFSSDGRRLASTHGDHTVKIIDYQTGKCLKVLRGHRRTPWVVRFHPLYPDILASGSLDHEVRLWDAQTATCIGSRDFYRPIASIAFHAQGELLAVASGHKLYIWNYNKKGEASSPTIILKTRRSLRAVHFHPHAAPFLLTAEVNDLDSSDSQLTYATSPGYLQYPHTVFSGNLHSRMPSHTEGNTTSIHAPYILWPAVVRDGGRISFQHSDSLSVSVNGQPRAEAHSHQQTSHTNVNGQFNDGPTPMEISPPEPASAHLSTEDAVANSLQTVRQMVISDCEAETIESNIGQGGSQPRQPELGAAVSDSGQMVQYVPFTDPACWELPFLQGWLMGRTYAGFHVPGNPTLVRTTGLGEATASGHVQIDEVEGHTIPSSIQAEISKSMAAAAAAELPCTVKLRVWPYNVQDPCSPLDADTCRLSIPHAVLCSEMGAHFSPCGKFLAACVACVLPNVEGDPGLQLQVHHDAPIAGTSPTRHPISAHQVMYELRIYSLEEATFGSVLASRPIRAAHCLTSIQFSPTSEHILLAYGRRHSSLLRSFLVEGETTVPIYTILEVYRVSDMELVRVLPSAEDEVNVACFHPVIGGGLVYGTKEGKLRILQVDGPHSIDAAGSSILLEESTIEVQRYALEC